MKASNSRWSDANDVNNLNRLEAAFVDAEHKLHNPRIAALIEQLRDLVSKLQSEDTSEIDLKILSRTFKELRYAFKVFSPYRFDRKVTVFGSARTLPDAPTYQQAVEFGRKMAELDWLVLTGAASGIMEAGHIGAGREKAMGVNIMLPFEQEANPVIAGDPKLVNMKYFFTRKLMFVKECHAFCMLPGGFGTLDEAFEVLTLMQTGKRELAPIVFLDAPGETFWQEWNHFIQNRLLKDKMISEEDLALYTITESVDDAVAEINQFYRNYHSQRFVKRDLVLRLRDRPSEELLDALNTEFADLLSSGSIRLSDALPEEADEPEASTISHLPRLVMHFNRRNLGQLRMLIDSLNAGRIVTTEVADS